MRIIVLAKQVPDTRNVGKDAMKADGTINRAALPAIFNPEDLSALEQALRLKERYPGSTVTLLTMGPGRAAEIIREGLYRGADDGVLLTDRAFAGADTLATSYALAMAIRKIGDFDLIVGGRQATAIRPKWVRKWRRSSGCRRSRMRRRLSASRTDASRCDARSPEAWRRSKGRCPS